MASVVEESKRTVQIGLPTPGTPPADDFDQAASPLPRAQYPPIVGLSTPVSPAYESFHPTESGASQDDQLLYPDYKKPSQTEKPLFESSASQRSPSPGLHARFRSISVSAQPAARKDDRQTARAFLRSIPSNVVGVVQIYNHDPHGYSRYIADQNARHRALRREHQAALAAEKSLPLPTISASSPRDPQTLIQLDKLMPRAGPRPKKGKPYSCPSMTGPIIGMPAGTPDGPPLLAASASPSRSVSPERRFRPATSNKRAREDVTEDPQRLAPPSPPKRRRQPAQPAQTVNEITIASPNSGNGKRRRRYSSMDPATSPQLGNKGKTHTRAQASKKVDDDLKDDEWQKLPDYCPPLSSLDESAPGAAPPLLRVSWGTSDPLDLSRDPDAKHLHPQEVALAATLRFHCNQYLINKRRIFKARMRCLREGRAFNKTACQQCTAMDVNKASKLWAAFDAVGWFDERHFLRFLE